MIRKIILSIVALAAVGFIVRSFIGHSMQPPTPEQQARVAAVRALQSAAEDYLQAGFRLPQSGAEFWSGVTTHPTPATPYLSRAANLRLEGDQIVDAYGDRIEVHSGVTHLYILCVTHPLLARAPDDDSNDEKEDAIMKPILHPTPALTGTSPTAAPSSSQGVPAAPSPALHPSPAPHA